MDTRGKAGIGVHMEKGQMEKRPRRSFSEEFKAGAIALVLGEGRTSIEVAKDLGISPSVLRRWVEQERADRGQSKKPGAMNTAEREELNSLRKEVRTLRMEREILKKAAAFFAKENH